MPRVREGYKGTYFEVREDVLAQLQQLAQQHGRSVSAELESAIRRHCATPPTLILVEGPAVAPEEVKPGTKAVTGRKPKKRGGKGS